MKVDKSVLSYFITVKFKKSKGRAGQADMAPYIGLRLDEPDCYIRAPLL